LTIERGSHLVELLDRPPRSIGVCDLPDSTTTATSLSHAAKGLGQMLLRFGRDIRLQWLVIAGLPGSGARRAFL
jgi:hypothetical protein